MKCNASLNGYCVAGMNPSEYKPLFHIETSGCEPTESELRTIYNHLNNSIRYNGQEDKEGCWAREWKK